VIAQVLLERRQGKDEKGLRAYAWADGRWTGLLLADDSGAIVRAGANNPDPAVGFAPAAILLRQPVLQREWPDRLSYESADRFRSK
jgi:hypothetical protein